MLAFEYGLTPDKVVKLTRRQISNLLDGLASRKSGYPETKQAVTIDTNDNLNDKIKALNAKRFGI